MTVSDYVIDLLLIAIVLKQVRRAPLTARSVLVPLAVLAFAGGQYLKSFPTAGNDVTMYVVLVVVGAAFGVVSGLTTKVWRDEASTVWCQAGVVAASVWVLGMAIRMAFDIWAHTHSGELSLVRFSAGHSITSADAYATAFVLMAFAQVLVRVGIMQYRRIRLSPPGGTITAEATTPRGRPMSERHA